jgi:site-specific DNA-methyltransferase (adenine-specific)
MNWNNLEIPDKPYFYDEDVVIYNADCRDILPQLPKVDLVLTDPPYGIYKYGGKWGHKEDLQWDRNKIDYISEVVELGTNAIIWGANNYSPPPSRGWLVWYKRDSVATASDIELAWTSYNMNARLIDHPIAATNAERNGHPTQKPLRVMRWCINICPDNPQTILDPFLGSGTTARAAKDLGRKCIGIEIEEKYCEIAAKRMAQSVMRLE